MRGVIFIAVLLALGIANGDLSMKCGFRIQTRSAKGYCYLNAGHFYNDKSKHSLDASNEYNIFFQCSGDTSNAAEARLWYWELPRDRYNKLPGPTRTSGSRLFTILPYPDGRFFPYYLDIDYTGATAGAPISGVGSYERNAKVDTTKYDTPYMFGMYGPNAPNPNSFVLGIYAGVGKAASWRLERDAILKPYQLVNGERVLGYEAKWQYTAKDTTSYITDNLMRGIPLDCGVTPVGGYDAEPIIDPNPAYDPNPSGLLIEIPANINYIQSIFIGVLLVSLMGFCLCAYTRKSPEKIKYKSVKFDSDTDAV